MSDPSGIYGCMIRPERIAPIESTRSIVVQPDDFKKLVEKDRHIARVERELRKYRESATKQATDLIQKVMGITTALFGKDIRIKESVDPEFRNDRYLVLTAYVDLSPEAIIRAEEKWAEEVTAVNPHWHQLRLLVYPK